MTSPRYACLHCNASVSPGVVTCEGCLREGHVFHAEGGCPLCKAGGQADRQLQDSLTAVLKDMLLLSLLGLLVPLSCLVCAPAPRAKGAAAFSPAGEWRFTWYNSSGPALFRPDGTLTYFWGRDTPQGRWDGLWELKGSTLHTWSWCSDTIPEPGTEKDAGFHWPLEVAKFSPRAAEGFVRGTPWKLEK